MKDYMHAMNVIEAKRLDYANIAFQKLKYQSAIKIFVWLTFFFLLIVNVYSGYSITVRAIAFLVLIGCIIHSYDKAWKLTSHTMGYLPGLWFGMFISGLSIFGFAVFCGLYFAFINPSQMAFLFSNSLVMGAYVNPISVSITIILEGMGAALITSLCIMQYYKNDRIHN